MKTCPKCNETNDNGITVCFKCGASLSLHGEHAERGKPWALKFLLGFLVLVGVIVGAVFLYYGNKPSNADVIKSAFGNIHIDTSKVNDAVAYANDLKDRMLEEQETTSQQKSDLDTASRELQDQIIDSLSQQGN